MSGPCGQEAEEYGHKHSHSHSHGHGGHGHSHSSDDKESQSYVAGESLSCYIDVGRARCMNVANPDMLDKVLTKDWDKRRSTESHILSDVDEDILVYIPFGELVKIKAIAIVGGTESDDAMAPSKVKLYVNRDDIDFDKASEVSPVQEFDLQHGSLGDMEYPLKTSKFAAVRDLTVVLPSNFGADNTQVNCIHLRGNSNKISTDRVVMNAVYETQGQLSDHPTQELTKAQLGT